MGQLILNGWVSRGAGPMPYLHLNIQQHNLALLGLLLNGHLAGTITVAAKLGMLNESILRNQALERVHGDEVVVDGIALTGSGSSRSVRHGQHKGLGVTLKEELV